jgi:predicted RNase H-like HicB family nuclease
MKTHRWADIKNKDMSPERRAELDAVRTYLVTYERDGSMWLARIESLDGCHTQGSTIDEARERIREALGLFDKDAAGAILVDDVRTADDPNPLK